METEQGLVDGLFNGFLICFPVALGVLLVATNNVLVSVWSILSIAFIVASVLGTVEMMGFPLGVAESIAGIIVVGFSVDYVVHMAHMFVDGLEHGCDTSEKRFDYSCRNMGGTIIAGAVTTAGSGASMFPGTIQFFYKMALLIVLTIMFSISYALFFFMPLVLVAGPDKNFGNLCKKEGKSAGDGSPKGSSARVEQADEEERKGRGEWNVELVKVENIKEANL